MNLAVTVALLPALFTGGGGNADGPVDVTAGETLETLPVRATSGRGVVVLGPDEVAAPTTTTTAPPTTTTTAAPVVRKRTVVVAAPTTTTTTAAPKPRPKPKPAPTTTSTTEKPAPPPASGSESGKATWYDHKPGICAHKTLPFGTVVTVTATKSGKSVQCTVGDRGPFVEGYVIDLHPQEFEQLAPRSTGVLAVRITWG